MEQLTMNALQASDVLDSVVTLQKVLAFVSVHGRCSGAPDGAHGPDISSMCVSQRVKGTD
eukprot:1147912-Pelagomonas_calceolata.AAC.10